MEYKMYNEKAIVRLDPGEEIISSLTMICEKEHIRLAGVSGIGAVNDVTLGVFDPVSKDYYSKNFKGMFEIISLLGNITEKEQNPYLHLHMSVGNPVNSEVYGGHLNFAVVSATAEIILSVFNASVDREMSDKVGLNLIKF